MPSLCLQCVFPVGCSSLLCLLLLSAGRIEHATGFMKPTASPMIANGRTAALSNGELWRRRNLETCPWNGLRRSIGRCLSSGGRSRRSKALSASTGGEQSTGSKGEDIVYAQDVLDRAWLSKRRAPAKGKSWPLGQNFLDKFVAPKTGIFVDDRVFMESTLDNVVRVYCTHNLPSWSLPWQRLKQEQSTSTGFVIDGKRIITNAHSVEYSTMIQVRGRGGDKKYQATCYAVGEECDLAILTVEDESFWEETSPLRFGELPELTDQVSVIGYPVGGECISITAGVVSRVEMTMYAQAEQELLSIQIDAAINPGNSGGPVVNDDGEVVGVAFQSLEGDDVENIGYVVPVNVLEHFLEDVRRHGKYMGFPRMGVIQQRLENPALRQSLKMSEDQTGVLVTGIEPMAPAISTLRKGDVVMKVDAISVANDGSIPFRSGERVSLRYYMSQLFPEDKIVVELIREEKVMSVTVPLFVSEFLCPVHFSGRPPSYFVLGGLVFTVMSNPYLETELDNHANGLAHLLSVAQHGRKRKEGEDIVILMQVLAHEVNVGYEGMSNLQLLAFNGVRVESLAHLVRLADGNTEPFLRFDFFPDKVVVLDAAGVPAATAQICRENSIPAPRSADMLQGPAEANGRMGITEAGQGPAVNGAPQPSITETVPTTLVNVRKRRDAGWRADDPRISGGRGSRLRSVMSAAAATVVRRLSERLGSGKWGGMRATKRGRGDVGTFGGHRREHGRERGNIFRSDRERVCENSRDIWRWRRRRNS